MKPNEIRNTKEYGEISSRIFYLMDEVESELEKIKKLLDKDYKVYITQSHTIGFIYDNEDLGDN